ncbi:Methyltransferase-like protein 25 [Quaeritorhiza haematococci]|nr:Methyltransferase-like protein 25 [Quaeritorhiza haematococci]
MNIGLPRDPDAEPLVAELRRKAKRLDRRVVYGMTPKKKIEVEILASLINDVAKTNSVATIVDMGAGQGYLDAVLAFQYGHTIIGVDDDEVQTCGATKRSKTMTKIFSKPHVVARMREAEGEGQGNSDECGGETAVKNDADSFKGVGRLFHVNRHVDPTESFADLVKDLAGFVDPSESTPSSSPPSTTKNWLLCGLHTCGDLAASMIRHFLHSDARVLVGVGCCYNHVTESDPKVSNGCGERVVEDQEDQFVDDDNKPLNPKPGPSSNHPPGFPLSACLKALSPPLHLGFTARTLACQATCRWSDPQKTSARFAFTRHMYRALLQLVIRDLELVPKSMPSRDVVIGRLGRGAFGGGFVRYARDALGRLGVTVVKGEDEAGDVSKTGQGEQMERKAVTEAVLEQYFQRYACREKEVGVVWTLRALLATAIESLILMDRFLYLVESAQKRKMQVLMFPIFEHVSSPRNIVIVAKKIDSDAEST